MCCHEHHAHPCSAHRLYGSRRARLTPQEAANGAGLKVGLLNAVEAEESVTEDEAGRIKDLIAALGG